MIEVSYEDYLTQPDALTLTEAQDIYDGIMMTIERANGALDGLWEKALIAITTYGDLRANWLLTTKDEHQDMARTAKHDAVIASLDAIDKLSHSLGINSFWRNDLGNARKRIGDFACYVSMFYGLCAR